MSQSRSEVDEDQKFLKEVVLIQKTITSFKNDFKRAFDKQKQEILFKSFMFFLVYANNFIIKTFPSIKAKVRAENFFNNNSAIFFEEKDDCFDGLIGVGQYLQGYILALDILSVWSAVLPLLPKEVDGVQQRNDMKSVFKLMTQNEVPIIQSLIFNQELIFQKLEAQKERYCSTYGGNRYEELYELISSLDCLEGYRATVSKSLEDAIPFNFEIKDEDILRKAKPIVKSLQKIDGSQSIVSDLVLSSAKKDVSKTFKDEIKDFLDESQQLIESFFLDERLSCVNGIKDFFESCSKAIPNFVSYVQWLDVQKFLSRIIEIDLKRYTKFIDEVRFTLQRLLDALNANDSSNKEEFNFIYKTLNKFKKCSDIRKDLFFSKKNWNVIKQFLAIKPDGDFNSFEEALDKSEKEIIEIIEKLKNLKKTREKTKQKDWEAERSQCVIVEVESKKEDKEADSKYYLLKDVKKLVLRKVKLLQEYSYALDHQSKNLDFILRIDQSKVIPRGALDTLNSQLTEGNIALSKLKSQIADINIEDKLLKPDDNFVIELNIAYREVDSKINRLAEKYKLLLDRIKLSDNVRRDQKLQRQKEGTHETGTKVPEKTRDEVQKEILNAISKDEIVLDSSFRDAIYQARLKMIQQSENLDFPQYLRQIILYLKQCLPDKGVTIKITGDIINTLVDPQYNKTASDVDFRIECLSGNCEAITENFCTALNLYKNPNMDPDIKGSLVRFDFPFPDGAIAPVDVFFTDNYKPLFTFHDVTITSEGEILGDDAAKKDWAERVLRPHKDEKDMKSRLENHPADFFVMIKLLLKGYTLSNEMKSIVEHLSFDGLSEKQIKTRNHKIKELYDRFGGRFLGQLLELGLAEKLLGVKDGSFGNIKALKSYLQDEGLIAKVKLNPLRFYGGGNVQHSQEKPKISSFTTSLSKAV